MTASVRVGVIGPTTWGTTLAVLLAQRGIPVRLGCRTAAEAADLAAGYRPRRLPPVAFPPALQPTTADVAVGDADAIILAVPSQRLRENARHLRGRIGGSTILISATKGLELPAAKRMSEVLTEELGAGIDDRIAVLSGPNLAGEIARGLPASAVIAARDPEIARRAQAILTGPTFRVYTQSDPLGVELAGALKNVIAIAAGIGDGLEAGDNAKAGLITRGLAEITRLGVAAGADERTFAGLAGLGDLVATCASRLSRNHTVGERLGRGESLPAILADLGQVAEGVPTTEAACRLARDLGIEVPIAEQLRQVLFEGKPPRRAVSDLMARAPTSEVR